LLAAAALFGAIALSIVPTAKADMVKYTTSLQSGNMCTGCGPFGTVTVASISGQPDELSVTLTLDPGEVFANTGAGAALLFDISGNPTLSVSSLLPTGYTFSQPTSPIMADGSGEWNTAILCSSACGSGTSPPQTSGPISFILAASSALTPQSFVTNTGKNGKGGGFLFASDIGIPCTASESGCPTSGDMEGYFTGDVVTGGPLTPVPLPATAWLMLSGLGGLGALARRKLRA
jgi:hypothetical protein